MGSLFVDDGVARQNYALVNVKGTWALSPNFKFFVRLDNVGNKHYIINRGYDMPGLTGYGGFTLHI